MESDNLLVPEPHAKGEDADGEDVSSANASEPLAEEVAEPWPFDAESERAAPPPREPPPPTPSKGVDRRLLVAAAAAVLLVLLGVLLLVQARRDVSSLQGELKALRAEVRRSQVLQDRGAVLRVRAELQALRQTLPSALAPEVDKADQALGAIDERLKASP